MWACRGADTRVQKKTGQLTPATIADALATSRLECRSLGGGACRSTEGCSQKRQFPLHQKSERERYNAARCPSVGSMDLTTVITPVRETNTSEEREH